MNIAIAVVTIPQVSELITAIKEAASVVHASRTGSSSHAEFVLYLEQVIAVLKGDYRYIHADVIRAIQGLQLKLSRIVGQLSRRNRSLVGRVRAMRVSKECLIEEARKEIDDTLKLIQASMDLKKRFLDTYQLSALSNGENRDAPPIIGPISVTTPASTIVPALQEYEERFTASHGQVCACESRDQTPLYRGTDTYSINEDRDPEALLIAAYKDYLHHRHLAANDPRHLICLAGSLDRLAKLLRKAGETEEATKHSREAVKIYRRVANGGLDQAQGNCRIQPLYSRG